MDFVDTFASTVTLAVCTGLAIAWWRESERLRVVAAPLFLALMTLAFLAFSFWLGYSSGVGEQWVSANKDASATFLQNSAAVSGAVNGVLGHADLQKDDSDALIGILRLRTPDIGKIDTRTLPQSIWTCLGVLLLVLSFVSMVPAPGRGDDRRPKDEPGNAD